MPARAPGVRRADGPTLERATWTSAEICDEFCAASQRSNQACGQHCCGLQLCASNAALMGCLQGGQQPRQQGGHCV